MDGAAACDEDVNVEGVGGVLFAHAEVTADDGVMLVDSLGGERLVFGCGWWFSGEDLVNATEGFAGELDDIFDMVGAHAFDPGGEVFESFLGIGFYLGGDFE